MSRARRIGSGMLFAAAARAGASALRRHREGGERWRQPRVEALALPRAMPAGLCRPTQLAFADAVIRPTLARPHRLAVDDLPAADAVHQRCAPVRPVLRPSVLRCRTPTSCMPSETLDTATGCTAPVPLHRSQLGKTTPLRWCAADAQVPAASPRAVDANGPVRDLWGATWLGWHRRDAAVAGWAARGPRCASAVFQPHGCRWIDRWTAPRRSLPVLD